MSSKYGALVAVFNDSAATYASRNRSAEVVIVRLINAPKSPFSFYWIGTSDTVRQNSKQNNLYCFLEKN